jgi:hypothetical protein
MIPRIALHNRWVFIFIAGSLVAVGGYVASRSSAEEASNKVLTLQGKKGAEVMVGDKVAASATKSVKFNFTNGAVLCTTSNIEGEVLTNPEAGKGNAKIEIKNWSFEGCSSTVGGAGSVWKITKLYFPPFIAETESPAEGGNGFTAGLKVTPEINIEIGVETPAKREIICAFGWKPLSSVYNNGNAEIEIFQVKANGGVRNLLNCMCPPLSNPEWSGEYRPLRDETGARKEKNIWIN